MKSEKKHYFVFTIVAFFTKIPLLIKMGYIHLGIIPFI